MNMSATMEIDPAIKQAVKFLHSPSPDSAEKIRQTLDEIIKQRYGSRKMLINSLSKKYLDEESRSPGTVKRRKSDEKGSSSSSVSSTREATCATQEAVRPAPEPMSISLGDGGSDEENLKEFGDLACVVCGAMVLTAGNRLVECAECHSLYHQECHKPQISDDDANEQEYSWCCSDCKTKITTSKASVVVSSPEKSSSSSSSSYEKHYSKSYEHSSSSSSKSKSSKQNSGVSSSGSKLPFSNLLSAAKASSSSSSSSPSPSINIISADQRLQIMKKKAAKQLESKRKQK